LRLIYRSMAAFGLAILLDDRFGGIGLVCFGVED